MAQGTHLASGYIDLGVRFGSAMKEITDALFGVQKAAGRAGDQAGARFTAGMNKHWDDAAAALRGEFQETEKVAGTSGRNAGTRYAKGVSSAASRIGDEFTAELLGVQNDATRIGRNTGDRYARGFNAEASRTRVALPGAAQAGSAAGEEAGGGFMDGFGMGVTGLLGKGGPVMASIAAASLALGKTLGPLVSSAMQAELGRDFIQAQLGLDDRSMAAVAAASAEAFAQNWGTSIESNMETARAAIQAGLLKATDSKDGQAAMIGQLTAVSAILGEDIPAVARSASQAIRTGIAKDATGAFDLLVAAQQNGLNVSGDLLDTVNEYGTQFRKLGLSGPEAFGLIAQAVRNGARDTDVAADALKEFSIRAIDNSETTRDAYTQLGLDADAMTAKFAAGGESARNAFVTVTEAIGNIKDPVEQSKIAVNLFGTQAEDLGAAMQSFDLSKAVDEFGKVEQASQNAADKMSSNSANEWELAKRNIIGKINEIKQALNMDEWFSGIPKAINNAFAPAPTLTPGAPGVPAAPAVVGGPAIVPPSGRGSQNPGQNPLDALFPVAPRAEGGIESHVAQIARGGAMRLWAEPETGGEAYIPLAAGKRARSTSILAEVADRFGYGLTKFDNGGITGDTRKMPDWLAAIDPTQPLGPGRAPESGLQADAIAVNRAISALFPGIGTIGGYREDSLPYHPSGRALDIMIPGWDTAEGKAYGDRINSFIQQNAEALGIEDTIWQDFWQPGGGGEGHKLGRGGATQGHYDHIHVTTRGSGAPEDGQQYFLPPAIQQMLNAQAEVGNTLAGGQTEPGTAPRTEGYIPAAAGSSSVAGTSFLSSIYGMGAEVINGLIDQAASAASSAAGAAATVFAPGSGGAASGLASAAIGMGTQAAKRGVEYGAQMLGIFTDSIIEQATPFGAPRLLTTDPTGFMPQNLLGGALPGMLGQVTPQPGQGPQPGPGVPSGTPVAHQGTGAAPGAPAGPLPGVGAALGKAQPEQNTSQTLDFLKPLGVYDQGGWLPPNGLALNLTKRTEPIPVFNHEQWSNISSIANTPVAEPTPNSGGDGGQAFSYTINATVKDAAELDRYMADRRKLDTMRYRGRLG
ncbi:phage tail tape measure protein [Mycolicibacterium neoaurum]|uniref:phage tail tape measure protein n=1 Tax=Mycolicibacterium neoaurum TaxID=1795 RepID=UPI001F4C661A|nr:phage tail tape measure protein [Mycolicibacterium neoaurum]